MSLHKGNSKINKIYKGSMEISKIYKGNKLIYQNKPLYYCYASSNQYFYFKEKVTEIKSYEFYHTGNYGETRANDSSELVYSITFTPDGIIDNGFYIDILGINVYYYNRPEWDLYT